MSSPPQTAFKSPGRARWNAAVLATGTKQTVYLSFCALGALASDLRSSSSASEQLMSHHAKTFRFAARFLPPRYRIRTITLYAFFRTLDDMVDETAIDPESTRLVRTEIDDWHDWFRAGCREVAPRPNLGAAVAEIRREFAVPTVIFTDFLEGMRSDLDPVQPRDRDDIERYSYQVASTVGLAMAHVFEATAPPALEAATRLGIAMQLTNIVRDIGGDLARDRVYLPESLLDEHSLSREELVEMWKARTGPDDRLRSIIASMIAWADENYSAGIAGIQMLPHDVRLPILISARLYQQILRQLECSGYDSLRSRAATSKWQKFLVSCSAAISSDLVNRNAPAYIGEGSPHIEVPRHHESEHHAS